MKVRSDVERRDSKNQIRGGWDKTVKTSMDTGTGSTYFK